MWKHKYQVLSKEEQELDEILRPTPNRSFFRSRWFKLLSTVGVVTTVAAGLLALKSPRLPESGTKLRDPQELLPYCLGASIRL